MFHLKLLGRAVVEDEAGTVSGLTSLRHPLALLALLATAPAGTLSRGKLVGFLWPDARERTARNRLTSCLYQVRRELGSAAVLTVGSDLRINRDVLACDVAEFAEALEAGEYRRAVELYGGPLLDGFWLRDSPEFEQWMDRERDRLRRAYQEALESLAREAEERGGPEAAAGWWRERASEDPYDSRVACRLMQSLAAAGNRAEALRVGREHTRLLEQEFEMEPGAELRDLIASLQASPAAAPTARNGVRTAGNAAGPAPAVDLPARSVAVLPFENLSGSEEAEPFAAGLHDDLLTELSRVSALTVISRTSVMRYRESRKTIPEIARELEVATVVEGAVQHARGRVRLNVQLTDARSGGCRWAERFDRELTAENIFELQSELAGRITRTVRAELTPAEKARVARAPTESLDAYRLHAHGRDLLDRRTEPAMRRAADSFRRALAEDPRYALAWVGLADTLTLLFDYGHEPAEQVLPEADAAVRRALELDPELAEAHASLGLQHSNRSEGPEAIRALRRAVEVRPGYAEAHNWLSWTSQLLGDREQALRSGKRAVELNPLSPEAVSNLAVSHYINGELEEALREARRGHDLEPEWTTPAFYEALALYDLRRFTEAAHVLRDLPVPWAGAGSLATLALAHAASGDTGAARAILTRFEEAGDAFAAGVIHAALGEPERTFEALLSTTRWDDWRTLTVHHYYAELLAPLRADPRWTQVVRAAHRGWGLARSREER